MYMAIVPSTNKEPCIVKMVPTTELMEKAINRIIVIRFSTSRLVSVMALVVITPHPLNRELGLGEEGYLDVT